MPPDDGNEPAARPESSPNGRERIIPADVPEQQPMLKGPSAREIIEWLFQKVQGKA